MALDHIQPFCHDVTFCLDTARRRAHIPITHEMGRKMLPFLKSLNDQIAAPARVVPGPDVICTACKGGGDAHSAYADLVCPACNGRGMRPSNWRELMRAAELAEDAEDGE